jgi:hypothetical protein
MCLLSESFIFSGDWKFIKVQPSGIFSNLNFT